MLIGFKKNKISLHRYIKYYIRKYFLHGILNPKIPKSLRNRFQSHSTLVNRAGETAVEFHA